MAAAWLSLVCTENPCSAAEYVSFTVPPCRVVRSAAAAARAVSLSTTMWLPAIRNYSIPTRRGASAGRGETAAKQEIGQPPDDRDPSFGAGKQFGADIRTRTYLFAINTRMRTAVSGAPGERARYVGGMRLRSLFLVSAAGLSLAGCAEVGGAVQEASGAVDKASVCTEALGLADLNPLVDPEKLKARAADKERRLRELAADVQDQDVKSSLLTMAGSYVEVQREHLEDATVMANWVKRNATRVNALRSACGL